MLFIEDVDQRLTKDVLFVLFRMPRSMASIIQPTTIKSASLLLALCFRHRRTHRGEAVDVHGPHLGVGVDQLLMKYVPCDGDLIQEAAQSALRDALPKQHHASDTRILRRVARRRSAVGEVYPDVYYSLIGTHMTNTHVV